MSKIPQGEWNAIAARYAQGESISRIAQSYGCTPPAIHYILKRIRQRAAAKLEQPLNGHAQTLPTPAREAGQRPRSPEIAGSGRLIGTVQQPSRLVSSERRTTPPQTAALQAGRDREIAPVQPPEAERNQPAFPPQQPGKSRNTGRASAFGAGLDSELHGRAEAAIEAFRLSFDAALAEGSPDVRQRLRKAASDLMRVAARTTIVLDQLNARAERAARAEGQSQPQNPYC
jgi:transposase-like protein